jgi:hypothetical protein
MKFNLILGFITGIIFSSGVAWLYQAGLPPLLPIVLIILSVFSMGLMLGGDE